MIAFFRGRREYLKTLCQLAIAILQKATKPTTEGNYRLGKDVMDKAIRINQLIKLVPTDFTTQQQNQSYTY